MKESFLKYISLIKEYMLVTGKKYNQIRSTDVYQNVRIGYWKYVQKTKYKDNLLSQEEEKELRNIGEQFNSNISDMFSYMVELINDYLIRYNKSYLQIKSTDEYEGVRIGAWKYTQRYKYERNELTEEEKQILRNLGEDFNTKVHKTFKQMLNIIKEYLKETNKSYLEIKYNTMYKDINIGAWKQAQRNKYKNKTLIEEEEQILRSLGEDFGIKQRLLFEDYVEIIKEYLKETNKSYLEIKYNATYKDINIGAWKQAQRYKYKNKKLTKEEEQILRNLGEDYNTKTSQSFQETTSLVKEYLSETNKKYADIKRHDQYKGFMIGHWKQTQRTKYKNEELSEKEINILKSLGEEFNIGRYISFEDMVYIILIYMYKTGKTYDEIHRSDIYNGIKIGEWKSNQKLKYHNHQLSNKEEQILRNIGEEFSPKQVLSFEEYVQLIKKYLEATNQTYLEMRQDAVYEDIKIGLWKQTQRARYTSKKLTKEEEQILRSLGEDFNIKVIRKFEEMVYIVLIYMHKTGKTYDQIRQCDTYEGIAIGIWKRTQRVRYKQGKLTEQQINALINLGEDFRPLKIRKKLSNPKLEKLSIPNQVVTSIDSKIKTL